MAIKSEECVPKSYLLSTPTTRRVLKFGRTIQNPPQLGKLIDSGTDFGDTVRDKGERYWSA